VSTGSPRHLVEEAAGQTSLALLHYLAQRGEAVWLFGTARLGRAAAEVGLTAERFVPVSGGRAGWWQPAAVRALRDLGPRNQPRVWSIRLASLVRRFAGAGPIHLHQLAHPSATETRALLATIADADTLYETPDAGLVETLRRAGCSPDRIRQNAPAVNDSQQRPTPDREATRRRWSLPTPETPVVMLLSDPPTAADAGAAAMVINLAAESTGHEWRLLVHPEQRGRRRAQRVLDELGVGSRLIQDEQMQWPPRLLPGVDAVLLGTAPAPLTAGLALAAHRPVVAPDRPCHRSILPTSPLVHLAPTDQPKKLADRLQHDALGLPGLRHASR
jgi:hypothetical protein